MTDEKRIKISNYIKPIISRDNILNEGITAIDIYKYYIEKPFSINKAINSPFGDDNIPSFGIFESKDGTLLYNDFRHGSGDCFKFVKTLLSLPTWHDTYSRIAIDFCFDDKYQIKDLHKISNNRDKLSKARSRVIERRKQTLSLQIKIRKYKEHDIKYWEQFGISIETLKLYRVYPITHIFINTEDNERVIPADKYAYAFLEFKDGKPTYKIYQPYSKYKWMNNHNFSVWQGWKQMTIAASNLIITKSLKDVMSIVENTGIESVSLQQEGAVAKPQVIEQLKKRFENIVVLYDNDYNKDINWGLKYAEEFSDMWSIPYILIPEQFESKDFSDLVRKIGRGPASKILNELFKNKIK